jgi:hypothetical protein
MRIDVEAQALHVDTEVVQRVARLERGGFVAHQKAQRHVRRQRCHHRRRPRRVAAIEAEPDGRHRLEAAGDAKAAIVDRRRGTGRGCTGRRCARCGGAGTGYGRACGRGRLRVRRDDPHGEEHSGEQVLHGAHG